MSGLDRLGELIMCSMRDQAIDKVEGLLVGHWKAPSSQSLQNELRDLPEEYRDLVRRCVVAAVDTGIHDFLFALHQACEDDELELRVDGESIADLSDGLQAEPFGDDGWQARFSKHGEAPEED